MVLDAVAGSDQLKLADYGTLSLPLIFLHRTGAIEDVRTTGRLSVGPEFRTDKKFDNRDVGLNGLYQFRNAEWDQSLERQSSRNPPSAPRFGRRLTFGFGIEDGLHLASVHPELKNKAFVRLVARPDLILEWQKWTLDIAPQLRYLFRNELAGGEDSLIVATRKGSRTYVRTELTRDLGFLAITIANTSGRVPPAFSRARATTIGVTFRR